MRHYADLTFPLREHEKARSTLEIPQEAQFSRRVLFRVAKKYARVIPTERIYSEDEFSSSKSLERDTKTDESAALKKHT